MRPKIVASWTEISAQCTPDDLKDHCRSKIRDALSVLYGPEARAPSDAAVNRLLKRAQLRFCLSRIHAAQKANKPLGHILSRLVHELIDRINCPK